MNSEDLSYDDDDQEESDLEDSEAAEANNCEHFKKQKFLGV